MESKVAKLVKEGMSIKDAILKVANENGYQLNKNGQFEKKEGK
jgi:uncharacterized protein YoaH (UPF0181 family)